MLEMDVSITKDGVVIMSHDTTLDRRTNAEGEIAEWNYTDLLAQRVDFGYYNTKVDGVYTEKLHIKIIKIVRSDRPTCPAIPTGCRIAPQTYFVTRLIDVLEAFPEQHGKRRNQAKRRNGA